MWLFIPSTRFASDEGSYFQVGSALLEGRHDAFWPPVTGWLIALVRYASGSDSVAVVRLAWVAMDVACVAAIAVLAGRAGRSIWPSDPTRARLLTNATAAGYALYLPAISFSQFATSEVPALLAMLLMLVLVTSGRASAGGWAMAGVMAGVMCLTRPSLLPLLVLVPLAITVASTRASWSSAVVFVLVGGSVIGGHVLRNWQYAGEFTISTNSAYNLFIGNRDMYAEDLNLLSPRATREQIEFRRQQFNNELPAFTQSPAESQRLAMEWIRDNPLPFLRRATGRLARVFVPKTDVLELLGGEQRAGIFSPASLGLLTITNLQWLVVLAGGCLGVFALRHADWSWWLLITAVTAGAVALCTIAISKPRYSFVFDPLLLMCAVVFWLDRARWLGSFTRADRSALAVTFAFLAWAWMAFAIFAVSSRSAL